MSSIPHITTYKHAGPINPSSKTDVNDEWHMFLSKSNTTGFDFNYSSPTNVTKQTPKYIPESKEVKEVKQNLPKSGKEKKRLVVKNPDVAVPILKTAPLVEPVLCLGCDDVNKNNTQPTLNLDLDLDLDLDEELDENIPVCDDLYISTKTKVLFLNQEIDINNVFWNIPITEYWRPLECVVKKQMKIVSKTPEEYDELVKRLKSISYYTENVIKQINNPSARRIKFKDERKITIGISKKDIMNCRSKVKNAFYNCFAMILRFKYQSLFREIHVKVFNTGKLEIPGILNAEILQIVSKMILDVLQPHIDTPLSFVENKQDENVLINSNFNCGFYINREKLFSILRSDKYGIETSYDPCIYPGIKCKYYFNNEAGFDKTKQTGNIAAEDRGMKKSELSENKKYTEVSFMIFRTGSCLIVGNCSEATLKFIFEFIKDILVAEYTNICVANEDVATKGKKTKLRKKNISISNNYYSTIVNTNV
jgi:hypothetical protein